MYIYEFSSAFIVRWQPYWIFEYMFPYIFCVTDISNLHYVFPKCIFVTYDNDTPCILRNFSVPLGLMAAILDLAILDSVLFCWIIMSTVWFILPWRKYVDFIHNLYILMNYPMHPLDDGGHIGFWPLAAIRPHFGKSTCEIILTIYVYYSNQQSKFADLSVYTGL